MPLTYRDPRCSSPNSRVPLGVGTASSAESSFSVRKRNLGILLLHSSAVTPSMTQTLSVGEIAGRDAPALSRANVRRPRPSASAASTAAARGAAWTARTCISIAVSCTSSKLQRSSPVSIDTEHPLRRSASAPTFMPSPKWPTAFLFSAFLLKPSSRACLDILMLRFTRMSLSVVGSWASQPMGGTHPPTPCATLPTNTLAPSSQSVRE
mmetsp:Transcript_17402/g.31738  ORF Transcript_17402/g.31738 Transcript_17402/m.31738 type:complete len:209 (+) Transcript_17402:2216-2842(+)